MKIILVSVGTRGDMEPFLAIAEILGRRGHQVICAFPEQFRHLVEKTDFEFASLGSKLIELLESKDGRMAMGGGGSRFEKFLALLRLARNQSDSNKELVFRQYELIEKENPDRIVYNGKAVYPILWGLSNLGKTTFISPLPYMHYVKGHTHVAFNSNFGGFFNKLTFSLAHFGMTTTVLMAKKWLKIKERISRLEIKSMLQYNKSIYTISPSLFSRPAYWPKNLQVLGYHQVTENVDWHPSVNLQSFLERHHKILLISFGSMLNPSPQQKTNIIIDILHRNKIPAVINTAAGGLVNNGHESEYVHFVSQVPYRWIFPQMHGVIHHGGSGTTHLGLKYGCTTMIIPHIIDQFVWNKIVADLGAGPKGIKIGKITKLNLEPLIKSLYNDASYKARAEHISSQMKNEDFEDELYESIVA